MKESLLGLHKDRITNIGAFLVDILMLVLVVEMLTPTTTPPEIKERFDVKQSTQRLYENVT